MTSSSACTRFVSQFARVCSQDYLLVPAHRRSALKRALLSCRFSNQDSFVVTFRTCCCVLLFLWKLPISLSKNQPGKQGVLWMWAKQREAPLTQMACLLLWTNLKKATKVDWLLWVCIFTQLSNIYINICASRYLLNVALLAAHYIIQRFSNRWEFSINILQQLSVNLCVSLFALQLNGSVSKLPFNVNVAFNPMKKVS